MTSLFSGKNPLEIKCSYSVGGAFTFIALFRQEHKKAFWVDLAPSHFETVTTSQRDKAIWNKLHTIYSPLGENEQKESKKHITETTKAFPFLDYPVFYPLLGSSTSSVLELEVDSFRNLPIFFYFSGRDENVSLTSTEKKSAVDVVDVDHQPSWPFILVDVDPEKVKVVNVDRQRSTFTYVGHRPSTVDVDQTEFF